MATAAGIIVIAGTITIINDALNAPINDVTSPNAAQSLFGYVNWRVIPATVVAAMFFAGLESLNPPLAKGIAGVALLTTLIHPLGTGPSPLVHLAQVMGYGGGSSQTSGFNAPLPTPQGPISV